MIIDNVNFHELEPQKYWAPPSSWSKEKIKTTTEERIFSGNWYGARKMDGAFYKFVKGMDGTMELLGRSRGVSGDYLNKIEWVPHLHRFFESLPNGTCLLGEIYFPNKEGSKNVTTIMGCLADKAQARQAAGDKLHYYIFDILAWDGKSLLKISNEKRFEQLKVHAKNVKDAYVEWAHYLNGKELWEHLQVTLSHDGEGIVMSRDSACYQPGKRPSKDCQKVKKEVQQTIDCFFTGAISAPTHLYNGKEIEEWIYWENEITGEKKQGKFYKDYKMGEPIVPVTKPYFFKWPGSLAIGVLKKSIEHETYIAGHYLYGHKIVPIGYLSGLSDEIKQNYRNYVGKPIEVTCMEIDPETGGLRHAKLVQFRNDLTIEDCTWEKFMG